jgi:hypothetical protein
MTFLAFSWAIILASYVCVGDALSSKTLLLSIVITLYDYTTFQFGYSFHWLCMCW